MFHLPASIIFENERHAFFIHYIKQTIVRSNLGQGVRSFQDGRLQPKAIKSYSWLVIFNEFEFLFIIVLMMFSLFRDCEYDFVMESFHPNEQIDIQCIFDTSNCHLCFLFIIRKTIPLL